MPNSYGIEIQSSIDGKIFFIYILYIKAHCCYMEVAIGCALSIMVIIIGNGPGDPSSKSRRGCLCFFLC